MLICTGCGSTKSIKVMRRGNPAVISCCPERDMREAQEFFVVPEYDVRITRASRIVFKIVAIFAGRTDIVVVQDRIATLPAAKRARLRWYSR